MKTLVFFALAFFSATAAGEVKETAPNLFVIEKTLTVTSAPSAAYTALTRQVGKWWDPEHTWSGDARNLTLNAYAGGCFCEKLVEGGSVSHGRVIWAQPGKMLRLESSLGPLQDMAVAGVLSFKLEPVGATTRLTMTYRVSGNFTMESTRLAPLVDQVLGVQLERFRMYVATGSPTSTS
jgi:hypothetical protein